MSSTIPDIKAALVTRFAADDDLSDIQCTWGHPYPDRSEEELIIIGPATETEIPAGLGTNNREESYNLDIIVSVARASRESQQTLETRAFVIAGHIEDSIVDWRTEESVFNGINGWIIGSAMTTGEVLETHPESGQVTGREASVTITLAVVARK